MYRVPSCTVNLKTTVVCNTVLVIGLLHSGIPRLEKGRGKGLAIRFLDG